MVEALKKQLLRWLPSPQLNDPNGASTYGRRLDGLSALACIAVPSFTGLFAWYAMWPLFLAMAGSGVLLVTASLIYRWSGSLVLGREIYLVSLFAFNVYEVAYFGTILAPGSAWLVAVPVLAIMVGGRASGLAWVLVTVAAIVALGLLGHLVMEPASFSAIDMQIINSIGMIYLVTCLAMFVYFVEYERSLAIVGLIDMNETVRKLVVSDPLTGVFNRRHLGDLIAADDARPIEARLIRAVVMIDIDHFKSINDRFGHLAGDSVIKCVVEAIATEAGPDNPVGRFGGEEFVCLVQRWPGARNGLGAQRLAEAIRCRVSGTVLDGVPALERVTVSIGFADCARFGSTQAALPEADFALYAAKEAGRNCVREARPEPRPVARAS
ncbi:GGDEF domain-containing protein [Methylobacterium frigidaeris]|uniref:diguanylate cyclase n=2 Tax=Methylobacterium frigidaeris TaxID=2038277 RepID=A0AA37M6M2_9HYPH|nr:GGDEF domain-containing protein [Methylobacterium frigidaeris]GJD65003.1 hypothetical protein MPEAHAMD_5189 [Methylobacterium frigidaeris]